MVTSAAPENPQTPADALPKSWDPSAVEADLYQGWVDAGYFQAD
ncbi:MAG: valyl-tRNA synthetase, partial [Rhodococcus sp. (in: high G+C Gram-positive bacteria)]